MNIAVQFSIVDEFLEELERDLMSTSGRVVARNLVRVGVEQQSFMGGRRLYVRASYVSDQAVIGIRRTVQLVELIEFAGTQIGTSEDERAEERVAAITDAVKQACARLDLECRYGAHRAVA
jgi:hypothetical protein